MAACELNVDVYCVFSRLSSAPPSGLDPDIEYPWHVISKDHYTSRNALHIPFVPPQILLIISHCCSLELLLQWSLRSLRPRRSYNKFPGTTSKKLNFWTLKLKEYVINVWTNSLSQKTTCSHRYSPGADTKTPHHICRPSELLENPETDLPNSHKTQQPSQ